MNASPKPQQPKAATFIKKCVSLPPKTAKKGERRATQEGRNFSNYIAQLINADDGK